MEILLSTGNWPPKAWVEGLSKSNLVSAVHVWPTESDLSNVEVLLVWKPLPAGIIELLPNLKFISSIGAGVDHLLGDSQIPLDLPVARIVDERLTGDMTNYVMMAVVMHQRNLLHVLENQKQAKWERHHYPNLRVGVMGLGELGGHLARTLSGAGFEVSGYSRSSKQIDRVATFNGADRSEFLKDLDVLVNLLPVTSETENILNKDLFGQIKPGAFLINVARGAHLDEMDLLDALEKGIISRAMLDVFKEEPLPSDHPFWGHPKITITPHIASVTTPASAMKLVLENCRRLRDGEKFLHLVDLQRGY